MHDATSAELYGQLRRFIALRAQNPKNRIVIFFSGHGYTTPNDFGYLVPIDAPDPARDFEGFTEKALPIQTLQLLAQEGRSTHMLFMFDSCFSGSIFMTKGDPVSPAPRPKGNNSRSLYFLNAGMQPMRQFITAGKATERTPERSVMIPTFIKALEGNLLPGGDGYFTSKELGLWITQNVPQLSNGATHPQSGVIRDPELAFGDMVFQTPQPIVEKIGLANPVKNSPSADNTAAVLLQNSKEGECQGEDLPITPHPSMGLAITATQRICYGKKSFSVSVENIKVKSLKDDKWISGMFMTMLVYKDGKFADVRIYPIKRRLQITPPIVVRLGETMPLQSFKAEFEIKEEDRVYLRPPYAVSVAFSVESPDRNGAFWMSNSGYLMKLWDQKVLY